MAKIYFISLLIFISSVSIVYADFSEYIPNSLNNIIKIADSEIEEHGEETGSLIMWTEKYKTEVFIDEYPEKCGEKEKNLKYIYFKMNKLGEEFNEIFNYSTTIKYRDKNIKLIFQDVLVGYLEKEVKPKTIFNVYVLFGYYHKESNEIGLFVNEFDTPQSE